MNQPKNQPPVGRGTGLSRAGRFESMAIEPDWSELDFDAEFHQQVRQPSTRYFEDTTRSVLSENDSPDIPFRYSLNPYRGCLHGCSYCYARPSHEYLGLSAGLDFETKIFVKRNAPRLFRKWLCRRRYEPSPVMMSGVTDCYQPVERALGITRRCLQVAGQAGQPMSIITKNALVRQYQALFKMDGVELEFDNAALDATARLSKDRKAGARGLRSIVEELLVDVMYELPSMDGVAKCIISEETVTENAWPQLLDENGKRLDKDLPEDKHKAAA